MGQGPINDDEGYFVSADFKCFRSVGGLGLGGGPIMMIKDSLFLLISNVSKRGCGTGRRPNNDGE